MGRGSRSRVDIQRRGGHLNVLKGRYFQYVRFETRILSRADANVIGIGGVFGLSCTSPVQIRDQFHIHQRLQHARFVRLL
jgi:hypothetical protein